jgi:hypothetical protein
MLVGLMAPGSTSTFDTSAIAGVANPIIGKSYIVSLFGATRSTVCLGGVVGDSAVQPPAAAAADGGFVSTSRPLHVYEMCMLTHAVL